jgi:hypothetical protein
VGQFFSQTIQDFTVPSHSPFLTRSEMRKIPLNLRTLTDSEVGTLDTIFRGWAVAFMQRRTRPQMYSPTLSTLFNRLHVEVELEKSRRAVEHQEVGWMLEHGDTPNPTGDELRAKLQAEIQHVESMLSNTERTPE